MFDARGATELAFLNRGVFSDIDDKQKLDTHQKRKVDRQIVAICKVYGVTELYTDDAGLATRARLCGIEPVSLGSIAIPEGERQGSLELEAHEDLPDPDIEDEKPVST